MRPIITIVFFCALIYYFVHYSARLFRYIKNLVSGEKTSASDDMIHLHIEDEDMNIVFPEGEEQINKEVDKLRLLLEKSHSDGMIKLVFVGSAIYFSKSTDKSEGKLIAYIQELSQYSFTVEESKIMHDFVYTRVIRSYFGSEIDDSYFDEVINDVDELTGCDQDQLPQGVGAFGLEIHNPIPVKGIMYSEYYLNRLRTLDGGRISWERTGSQPSPVDPKPVDVYNIFDIDRTQVATIYIAPYHKRVSNLAPEGFRLLTIDDLTSQKAKPSQANSRSI